MNLYFQDESRFGLKTHLGRCLTAKGIKPIVKCEHQRENTYLYGSYSPIDGDSFVWEVQGVSSAIFEAYIHDLAKHKADEYKILIIDNASFHSTKNIQVPDNMWLLNIPPYCPELNPCEQIWQHIKSRFKNQCFGQMEKLKQWLYDFVESMQEQTIKSITSNHHYIKAFNATFRN